MNGGWRVVPWLNRFIMLGPVLLLTMLTVKIFADPQQFAQNHGMSLISPSGLTNYRAGNGGLFLASALMIFGCLISTRRHLVGLSFLATLMGVVLALRAVCALVDDTLEQESRLLIAEAVFVVLSGVGIALERARRSRISTPCFASDEGSGSGLAHRNHRSAAAV